MRSFLPCIFLAAILSTAILVKIPSRNLYEFGKIPVIGLGTWLALGEDLEIALEAALEAGYRFFDTATLYGNEATIGKVINRWIKSGRVEREDLYIMTKIPPTGNQPYYVHKYLKESLDALALDYVDFLLDQVPFGFEYVEGTLVPKTKENETMIDHSTDINAVWKAMEEEVKAGRVKHIGLSNFNQSQIERIIERAEIKPAVLQVEIHAYFQQQDMVDFCESKGIQIIGYSPLGSPGSDEFFEQNGVKVDAPVLLEDPVVTKIAGKYKKSPAQILIKHALQRRIVVIPKSIRPARIRENIEVFDFNLSEEDMKELNSLDRGEDGRKFDFAFYKGVVEHPEYPFTSRSNKTKPF